MPVPLRDRITFLGLVSEADKARMLRSVDAYYVAPNTGGESFGMILTEAMAAGAPVVASDLDAFRRVLVGAGALFPTGDAAALEATLARLLDDPASRARLVEATRQAVGAYDWPVVASRVLEVTATAIEATDGRVMGSASAASGLRSRASETRATRRRCLTIRAGLQRRVAASVAPPRPARPTMPGMWWVVGVVTVVRWCATYLSRGWPAGWIGCTRERARPAGRWTPTSCAGQPPRRCSPTPRSRTRAVHDPRVRRSTPGRTTARRPRTTSRGN